MRNKPDESANLIPLVKQGAPMSIATTASHYSTPVDLSLLAVRIVAGAIFAAHGAQKLFGAFGGPGLEKTVEMMGMLGYLVTIGEFFGGLGLIAGFLTRFSAASLIVIMLGAIAMVHGKNGFFMSSGGFEYNLALIGLLLPTLLAGPGGYSIGRMLPLPKARGSSRPILVLE
jgi:putative oxidoreductase